MSFATTDNSMITHRALSNRTYTSSTDYWIAVANANIETICNNLGLDTSKEFVYTQGWLMRSLIPALYNPSLDSAGFPLFPANFHSQIIMVTDVESNPCITAVIDWTLFHITYIIICSVSPVHPAWEDSNPLCVMNTRSGGQKRSRR